MQYKYYTLAAAVLLVQSTQSFFINHPHAHHHHAHHQIKQNKNTHFVTNAEKSNVQKESISESSTKIDLNAYLTTKIPFIEAALLESVKSHTPYTDKICNSMEYSLMAGGKRIRPILCLAACEMFYKDNGNSDDIAMPTAVALEMIHTMSLIHDDLPSMDNDDLRRGKPTNHILYGEDVAILAGDAMLSTSFEHCAKYTPREISPERTLQVVTRLAQCVGPIGLAGGQVMDLACEAKQDATLDELRWIHTHKTAALLVAAVTCGAILGGASQEEVLLLEEYATKIGLAFQVADDILDCTASTEELGKTAGKDEDVGKTTYVKLMGLEGAKEEAKRLGYEAKACLDGFGDRAGVLLAIADYIVDRKN